MAQKVLRALFTLILISSCMTSCYPMPNDDECSVIPTTNNPNVVGDKGAGSWMPSGGF